MARLFSSLWSLLLASTFAVHALAAPPDSAHVEAAERFDRAIRLVNAGDLSGGLAEFQRAYALVPSTIVLYNTGLVYAELSRPVQAARALQSVLQSPEALRPEELERARAVLRAASERIGNVELIANVTEGVVELDNVEVAKLPLPGPLPVASGVHALAVISPGYAPARREVVVAGKQTTSSTFELVVIEGLFAHLAIECKVPAVDVWVDGQRVGKTPLETTVTVAPGSHEIELRRPGYHPVSHSVRLQDGATATVAATPEVDPAERDSQGTLAIRASETQAVVSVDGESPIFLRGPLQLPYGPHRLRLERGGFLPAALDVDVPLARTKALSVVFEPTPETRASYVAAATRNRTLGFVTLGVGAALAAGGSVLAIVEQNKLPAARADLASVNQEWVPIAGGACDFTQESAPQKETECTSRLSQARDRVHHLELGRTLGVVTAGVGGLVLTSGLVLLLTGDSPHKYDEKPNQRRFGAIRFTPLLGPGLALFAARGSF